MLASFVALVTIGAALPQQAKKPVLHDPATLKADFNAAKGVPRVVIILSPS